MTVFSGQTENAGHFLQPATMAIGHKVIALLLRWLFTHRADHDVLLVAIVSVSRRACNASPRRIVSGDVLCRMLVAR